MTAISAIPPGAVLIAGAVVLPFLAGRARSAWVLLVPLVTLWHVWQIPDGATLTMAFLDYTLEPVEGDRLSRLFGTIFAIMAFAGGLFAMRQSRTVELAAAYVYAGSALVVVRGGHFSTVNTYIDDIFAWLTR